MGNVYRSKFEKIFEKFSSDSDLAEFNFFLALIIQHTLTILNQTPTRQVPENNFRSFIYEIQNPKLFRSENLLHIRQATPTLRF